MDESMHMQDSDNNLQHTTSQDAETTSKPDVSKPPVSSKQKPKNEPKNTAHKSAKPPTPSSWSILGTDLTGWMRDHAFAIVVTALFFTINIVEMVIRMVKRLNAPRYGRNMSLTQILMHPHAQMPNPSRLLRPGEIFPWLGHIARSAFFVRSPLMLIVYTVLILVILSLAQSRLRVFKTLVTAVVSAVIGSALGLTVCIGVDLAMRNWQHLEILPVILSPLTLVIGALMAESAYESFLWRRRIILLVYTIIGTMLLFSGNPGDYCTLGAAITGHVLGLIMHGPARDHTSWLRGTDYETRRLFAFAQLVFAFGPVLALTSTSRQGPLTNLGLFVSSLWSNPDLLRACSKNSRVASCVLLSGQHSAALIGLWLHILLPMAALIIVAWGLYHGRKLAARVSIVLNGASAVFSVMYYVIFPFVITPKSPDMARNYSYMPAFVATALPPLLMVIFLLRNMEHFTVPTGRNRAISGLLAIVGTLLATVSGYVIFALTFPADFKPRPTFKLLLLDLIRRLLPAGFGGRKPVLITAKTLPATIVSEGFAIVFWVVLIITFILWFRDRVAVDERDRMRAEKLVTLGGQSMSFMTTWDGNHYWFSQSGRCGVAYRVLHGIALTVTGPFGDPAEYRQALSDFTAFCETNGWTPSFYAIHDVEREELEAMGWSSIQVGTEMIIDPNQWQTRGKKWQDIRTAINKAKRDGITDVLTTYEEAGFDIQQQIVEISEQWAQMKALPEMKFTLGGIEELEDPRVALLYAVDEEGTVLGVTSWLPTYREGRVIGWTLDFMRHRTDSPNGIMELLIARMAERLRDQGQADPDNAIEFMSLSAAPLAGMGEGRQTPQTQQEQNNAPAVQDSSLQYGKTPSSSQTSGTEMIEHVLQIAADVLEPAYAFKSLFFFKKKFQPSPSPIYICYPDAAKLAQIGFAVVNAYVPGLKPAQVVEILKSMTPDGKNEGRNNNQ
jgi:phosphatidylglycerol lysyltransferase